MVKIKTTSLIITLFLSSQLYGRLGYSISCFSIRYGQVYQQYTGFGHNVELNRDLIVKTCTNRKSFHINPGFNYTFNQHYKELGLKLSVAIKDHYYRISRKSILVPMLFCQTNFIILKSDLFPNQSNNCRVGSGIFYFMYLNEGVYVSAVVQLGYQIDNEMRPANQNLVPEFKVGLGLNPRIFKKNNNTPQS